MRENSAQAILDNLCQRYPSLEDIRENIWNAFCLLRNAYSRGNKLLICGNGGSAADCGHIVGELMKGFEKKRALSPAEMAKVEPLIGTEYANLLQGALPAIDLTQHHALNTAVANDNAPELIFAQQVWGFGVEGDVLIGISTSGNAKNVCLAAQVAKAKGMAVLSLTGASGGKLADIADCAVKVQGQSTAQIQELHLPIYHGLCLMLEEVFFMCTQNGAVPH